MHIRNPVAPIPTGQDWLLEKFKAVGFNKNDSDGICFGVAETAAHLIMLDEGVERFNHFLHMIHETPTDEFKREFDACHDRYLQLAIKAKAQARAELKGEELPGKSFHIQQAKRNFIALAMQEEPKLANYLLIHCLFNEVEIFHALSSHQDIAANKYVMQQSHTVVFDWILDKHRQKDEAIEKLDSFTSPFVQKELQRLFSEMETLFKQQNIKYPVRFGLSSVYHRISVVYLPGKGWAYADANMLPAEIIQSNRKLAEKICDSFFDDYLAMIAIQTYSFTKHADEVRELLAKLKSTNTYKKIREVDFWKINATDEGGVNWLTIAAKTGDKDAVNTLLHGIEPTLMTKIKQYFRPTWRLSADPNHKTKDGTRPLFRAIAYGHADIAGVLLDHGALINEAGDDGLSPLYHAVVRGQLEIVKNLITHGAAIDAKTKLGFTPLTQAIMDDNVPLTKLLLENGANANICDSITRTPLIIACESSHHKEIVELLIQYHANVHGTDKYGSTALYQAVKNGNDTQVESLLSHGANPNAVYFGETLIEIACKQNNIKVLKLLLDHHADVHISGLLENSLLIAVGKNNVEMAKMLLNYGMDVNLCNIFGDTPLRKAIKENNEAMVRMLIQEGADIYKKDKLGNMALVYANVQGNQEIINLLKQRELKDQLTANQNFDKSAQDNYKFNESFIEVKKDSALVISPLLFAKPTVTSNENAPGNEIQNMQSKMRQVK